MESVTVRKIILWFIFHTVANPVRKCSPFKVSMDFSNSTKWDYLMLVQRWPQAVCQIVNASGHPCGVPPQVKGWTIHGLWPSSWNSSPPFYCQDTKFDMAKINDLKDILNIIWPNLYLKESEDSLWKHEYEKHGTCAALNPYFVTEHNYFQRTLDLNEKFDVQRILENKGIFPRTDGYETALIINAIKESYPVNSCPGCGYVKDVGQVLSQSYVCMDNNLRLIDCPDCENKCDDHKSVLYQPLHFNEH